MSSGEYKTGDGHGNPGTGEQLQGQQLVACTANRRRLVSRIDPINSNWRKRLFNAWSWVPYTV
jgi:hypothetical protein